MSPVESKHAHLLDLVNSPHTVQSALAQSPTSKVSSIAHEVFPKPNFLKETFERITIQKHHAKTATDDESVNGVGESDQADLEWAFKCGKWGDAGRPSDLFLGMYAAALSTLHGRPLVGMVSPPLLGSSGQLPLTVVSVIPDIMKCMASLIVNAKKEVFVSASDSPQSPQALTDCF